MATFAGIDLMPPGAARGGGIFYLLQASTETAIQPLRGGVEVEVKDGLRVVALRGLASTSHGQSLADGLARAHEGLDLLSARGIVNAVIADVDTEHLAWWMDGAEPVLRFWGAARLTVTTGLITAVVTDPAGNVKPDPGPPTGWHERMRYFRQAQVTGDLFDAFRNLYLALESILSTICPMVMGPAGKPAEGEGQWFRRALAAAGGRIDLQPFAPSSGAPAPDGLYDELYVGVRTSVFHAKSGRPVLLPHDPASRGAVVDVLDRLARLYLELLRDETGVRFASGGIFAAFFRRMADGTGMDLLHLTDDESPVDASDTDVRVAEGKSILSVPLVRAPQFNETWFSAHEASVAVADITDRLPYLSKLVTSTAAGQPGILFTLEGRLDPTDFTRFEAVVGPRAVNTRMPRTRYLT